MPDRVLIVTSGPNGPGSRPRVTGVSSWSGGPYARQDRLAEFGGPGELRPVARGQVDVIDVADLGELSHGAG